MPPAKLTAVLGNCKRIGRWKIRPSTKALVLFGNCAIDYTDAYADEDLEEIKLDVLCLFGRAVFTLPPGTNVQPSAVSLLSSSKFEVESEGHTDADLPVIKLQSTTVFGLCRVQTVDPDMDDVAAAEPPAESELVVADPPPSTWRADQSLPQAVPPQVPTPPELPPLDLPFQQLDDLLPPLDDPKPVLEPPPLRDTSDDDDTAEAAEGEIAPPPDAVPGEQDPPPVGERPWLDDLDSSKAVVIDEETTTIHVGD